MGTLNSLNVPQWLNSLQTLTRTRATEHAPTRHGSAADDSVGHNIRCGWAARGAHAAKGTSARVVDVVLDGPT